MIIVKPGDVVTLNTERGFKYRINAHKLIVFNDDELTSKLFRNNSYTYVYSYKEPYPIYAHDEIVSIEWIRED